MSTVQMPLTGRQADWTALEDEAALVQRAKHDRQAFSALYRRHYGPVSVYVFRRTGDRHATEDLVSDVFLTALRTLPRFRYRGIPVRYWLLRIATNAVNRWARRQRRRNETTPPPECNPDSDATATPTPGQIDRRRARRALGMLSPKHQAVLALHYLEGLPVKEVAVVLGCRVGTVKSRLARARDALRHRLTQGR